MHRFWRFGLAQGLKEEAFIDDGVKLMERRILERVARVCLACMRACHLLKIDTRDAFPC